jgi:hypothetical protein
VYVDEIVGAVLSECDRDGISVEDELYVNVGDRVDVREGSSDTD